MSAIKKKLIYSIIGFIYIMLLPYLCRLPKGIDWAMQYLNTESFLMFIFGFLFFSLFAAIPALLLVFSIIFSQKYCFPFIFTFLILSVLIIYYNYNYDLASDAQAALGLIFMPIYATGFAFWGFLFGLILQIFIPRSKEDETSIILQENN